MSYHLPIAIALLLASFMTGRAEEPCANCHPTEAGQFRLSPMGQSVGAPSVFTAARIVHKLSGSTLMVRRQGVVLEHKLERRGVSAEYPVAYSVGAGIVGYSYIVRIGQYLFQSPLSYYTQTQSWDLTPGYETDSHLDFTHQIASGCLFCHTGSVNALSGAPNQFGDPPFTPISCERCHGSPAAHLHKPVPGSIVNPAKLSPRERNSVCEQCHLEGDARVLNPGRDWWDFQAGKLTESVFVTYLRLDDRSTLRAVSQSELLAESQCAKKSGDRLWCGSCHNPHATETNRAQEVRTVCLSCHNGLFESGRHAAAEECVSCHMPRLHATNVSHSAVTDHSIPRKPRPQLQDVNRSEPQLRAWREPDSAFTRRDLGLAYFDLAAKEHVSGDVRRAYEILSQLPADQRRDPAVEADLASVLLLQNQTRLAIDLFSRASTQEPSNARYAYCLGAALAHTSKTAEAVSELRRSIQLDPSQPEAYVELAQLYQKAGQPAQSRSVIEQYLHFMPQNIKLRQADVK